MLEFRLRQSHLRLPLDLRRLVSVVLAALIAAELLRAVFGLAHEARGKLRPVEARPAQTPPAAIAASRVVRTQVVDVRRIVSSHLFGVAAKDSSAEDPAHAPATTANLSLAGTIATDEPKRGLAIILDRGSSQVYSVGDAVGGAALHSVYFDHVILDRQGSLESLRLPRALWAGRSAPAANRSGVLARAKLLLDGEGRVVDREPGVFERAVRTVGQYDDDTGKLRGIHVYPVPGGAPLDAFGLDPGDLLIAINGERIDDSASGAAALDALKRSGQGTVTVERQGRTITVVLDMSRVGEARQEPNEAPNEEPNEAPPSG